MRQVFVESQPARLGLRGLAVLPLVIVFVLTVVRYAPPTPKGLEAPPGDFSAGRARRVLGKIAAEGPHPVGSEAHTRVRDLLVAELQRLGYEPRIERSFVCGPNGTCATVENVLAGQPGLRHGKVVLLLSHYDSVPAGSGVSDDGVGVAATLEIARILKTIPPAANPVVFLLTDGEEAGLLGAQAYARSHDVSREVGAVVNLDLRGTSGPSLMFETGPGSSWMIGLLARSLKRPAANSLFSFVYERMPNDTDFTVFRRLGAPGVNFACVGEPSLYHTSSDDLTHANPGSLQQTGDNALAMVRALHEADLPGAGRRSGDSVFFDVFCFGVLSWPSGWSLGLALLGCGALAVRLALLARKGLLGVVHLFRGLLTACALVLGSALAVVVLSQILRAAGAIPAAWVAWPAPVLAVAWLTPLAVASLLLGVGSLRSRTIVQLPSVQLPSVQLPGVQLPGGHWAGTFLLWNALSMATAWLAPGISYGFIVPCLLAGLTGGTLVPAAAAGALWFPIAWLLYDGIGVPAFPLIAALVALVLTAVLPSFAAVGRRTGRVLAEGSVAALLLAFAAAFFLPRFSETAPRHMNVLFHRDAGTGETRWIVGPAGDRHAVLPPALSPAASFGKAPERPFPWSGASSYVFTAPAPPLPAPPPDIVLAERPGAGGRRMLRIRIRSSRGARVIALILPAFSPVESLSMQGQRVPGGPWKSTRSLSGWRSYRCPTVPPEGLEVDLVLKGTGRVPLYVWEESPSLPAFGGALLKARSLLAVAVPYQGGDATVVTTRVDL